MKKIAILLLTLGVSLQFVTASTTKLEDIVIFGELAYEEAARALSQIDKRLGDIEKQFTKIEGRVEASIIANHWAKQSQIIAEAYYKYTESKSPTLSEMDFWREQFLNAGIVTEGQVLIHIVEHRTDYIPPSGTLPQPQAPPPDVQVKKAPQLFMAPLVRYLKTEEARVKLVDDMEASGLTGLHLVLQTDWFDLDGPLDFEAMGVRTAISQHAFDLIDDLWHRLQQRNPDYHLDIWLWGDSDWHLNPIKLQGPMGHMERLVYDEINRRWEGRKNLTFGAGWDCFEWLTREHLQQMVDYLKVPLYARGLTYAAFNDLADFPSIEHVKHTTEELEEFRRRYPDAPLLISADRCRQYTRGQWSVWQDNDRHFTREEQQRIYDDAVRLGVTVIFGKLGTGLEDGGSQKFDQPFNYREIGWGHSAGHPGGE